METPCIEYMDLPLEVRCEIHSAANISTWGRLLMVDRQLLERVKTDSSYVLAFQNSRTKIKKHFSSCRETTYTTLGGKRHGLFEVIKIGAVTRCPITDLLKVEPRSRTLVQRCWYAYGHLHGENESWNPNGSIYTRAFYENDKLVSKYMLDLLSRYRLRIFYVLTERHGKFARDSCNYKFSLHSEDRLPQLVIERKHGRIYVDTMEL